MERVSILTLMPSISAIILLLIFFCTHACKENAQEKEAEFELNKFEGDSLEMHKNFHLGGGICIQKEPWDNRSHSEYSGPVIYIHSCYDSLPADTMPPTENIMKYRQGGLCFYNDCSIDLEKSFTVLMNVPDGFIDSHEYHAFYIFASKYNDSTMLYKYAKDPKYQWARKKRNQPKDDTIMFFKKYDEFWEEFFSIAKPLKIEENATEQCNSKFCSTKDFLNPLYSIRFMYETRYKYMTYVEDVISLITNRKIKPKCLDKLESLSREGRLPNSKVISFVTTKYNILMHNGAFPAGDCDLSNWRYLKIDSLSKEHYEKLKDIVKPPNNAGS